MIGRTPTQQVWNHFSSMATLQKLLQIYMLPVPCQAKHAVAVNQIVDCSFQAPLSINIWSARIRASPLHQRSKLVTSEGIERETMSIVTSHTLLCRPARSSDGLFFGCVKPAVVGLPCASVGKNRPRSICYSVDTKSNDHQFNISPVGKFLLVYVHRLCFICFKY